MKKTLMILITVLLIGVLAFCVGWTIKNKDKIIEIANGANLYTEKDVEDAYNKGKADSAETLKEYEKQFLDYKKQLENLTTENNDKDNQIENLKANLNEYKTLLESIQNEDFCIVAFDNAGDLSLQIVLKNDYAKAPTTPEKQGYLFVGWTLNNEVVDLTTYAITENVTFVAKFEKAYQVKFMSEEEVISFQTLIEGEQISIPSNPSKINYIFVGWSLNGTDVIDNSEIGVAIEDITYYAVFRDPRP